MQAGPVETRVSPGRSLSSFGRTRTSSCACRSMLGGDQRAGVKDDFRVSYRAQRRANRALRCFSTAYARCQWLLHQRRIARARLNLFAPCGGRLREFSCACTRRLADLTPHKLSQLVGAQADVRKLSVPFDPPFRRTRRSTRRQNPLLQTARVYLAASFVRVGLRAMGRRPNALTLLSENPTSEGRVGRRLRECSCKCMTAMRSASRHRSAQIPYTPASEKQKAVAARRRVVYTLARQDPSADESACADRCYAIEFKRRRDRVQK